MAFALLERRDLMNLRSRVAALLALAVLALAPSAAWAQALPSFATPAMQAIVNAVAANALLAKGAVQAAGGDASAAQVKPAGGSVFLSLNYLWGVANYAEGYGAKGDGVTDDTAAINACMAAMVGGSGTCRLNPARNYLAASNLVMQPGVDLDCGPGSPGFSGAGALYDGPPAVPRVGVIRMGPNATVSAATGAGATGCTFLPVGMTFPQTDGSAFVGNLFRIPTGTRDFTLRRVLAAGFINTNVYDSDSAYADRITLDDVRFDNTNGWLAQNSFDTSNFHLVHNWPFATFGSASATAHVRHGFGFKIVGQSDDTHVNGFIDYGHDYGFVDQGRSNHQVDDYWIENNAVAALMLNSVNASLYGKGILYPGTGEAMRLNNVFGVFFGQTRIQSGSVGVHVAGGNANVDFGQLSVEKVTGAPVQVDVSVGSVHFGDLVVRSLASGNTSCVIANGGGTNDARSISWRRMQFDGTGGNCLVGVYALSNASLASASPLPIPSDGDIFTLTGSTAVAALSNGTPGRTVTLNVPQGGRVSSSANLALAKGEDFVPGASGGQIVLRFNGDSGTWFELSRSPASTLAALKSGAIDGATIGATTPAPGIFTTLYTTGTLAVSPTMGGSPGVTNKIALFGNPGDASSMGFGVSANALNIVVPSGAAINDYVGGQVVMKRSATGVDVPLAVRAASLLASTTTQASYAATVQAAGTTQATATALTRDLNVVTGGTGGVIVSGLLGQRQEVFNRSGAAINVYPPSGAGIESGTANAPVSLAAGAHAVIECLSATQCYQAP